MCAFKLRRLTVAVPLVLVASLGGVQAVASGSALRNPWQSHNPTCGTAFGERVCIGASAAGLTVTWSGKGFLDKTHRNVCSDYGQQYAGNRLGTGGDSICDAEDVSIMNSFVIGPEITRSAVWKMSSYHKMFVRLTKPGDYYAYASLSNYLSLGEGVEVEFNFIFPEVGNSDLTIKPYTLSAGKVGVRYFYRFSATGGDPPYTWTLIKSYEVFYLPKGLGFIGSGPEAGTIHGIPLKVGEPLEAVMVHDRVGHAAFMFTGCRLYIDSKTFTSKRVPC
jgi:hypothetical protein